MRFIRFIFTISIVLVVAAVVAVFVVPADWVAKKVIAQIENNTGREITFGKGASFTIAPEIGIALNDVVIKNPKEMGNGEFVKTKKLKVAVELIPLLSKSVKVKSFSMQQPVINFVIDKSGRNNWEFTNNKPRKISNKPGGKNSDISSFLSELQLNDVGISNGTLNYIDRRANKKFKISAINTNVSLPSLNNKLSLYGSAIWNDEKIEIKKGTVSTISSLLKEGNANLNFVVVSNKIDTSFIGKLSNKGGFNLVGDVDLSTPSIRKLAKWVGNDLGHGKGLNNFSTKGRLTVKTNTISLSGVKLTIDDMNAQGSIAVKTGSGKPQLKADLNIDHLNLNNYIRNNTSSSKKTSKDVKESTEWSKEKIDVSSLNAVNANLNIVSDKISYKDVKFGNGKLSVVLKNGIMNAKLHKFSLYGGIATGNFKLDGSKSVPVLTGDLRATQVNSLPLLKDFADFDWIKGKMRLDMKISGSGVNQKQLVSSLGGKINMNFSDGALRGVNVAKIVRGAKSNIINGWKQEKDQSTDFTELSAAFSIIKGVAKTNDIKMLGPLVRMTGDGNADMPDRKLKFRINPRIVASLKGQTGKENLKGLEIPIIIKGPWSNLKVYPDVKSLLENPEDALNKLKNVKQLKNSEQLKKLKDLKKLKNIDKNKVLNNVISNTIGNKDSSSSSNKNENIKNIGNDLLKDILQGQ